jgi:MFS transporter, putative metabolite transport protein
MTGVALPLIGKEFDLTSMQHGVVGAAILFGILIGASALGGLADRYGRKPMFIVEMLLFVLFLVAVVFTRDFVWLVVCLFGMGLALGCDYPTAHLVISESTPSWSRGSLVLAAFGFQSVAALVGTAVGFLVLTEDPSLQAWRWMYATAVIPAPLVLLGRFFVTESPHWLAIRERRSDAEKEILRLLEREPPYPIEVRLGDVSDEIAGEGASSSGYAALFQRRNIRATILASVPWFL